MIFLPTLLVISGVMFFLSLASNCDPAESSLGLCQQGDKDVVVSETDYIATRQRLGLDKPAFYLQLATFADSDTLHKIPYRQHRELLARLTAQFGNWNTISAYYGSLKQATATLANVPIDTIPSQYLVVLKDRVQILYHTTDDEAIKAALKILQQTADTSHFYTIKAIISDLIIHYNQLEPTATRWKTYLPRVYWHGAENQYHQWLTKFIDGDFGTSYHTKRPVKDEIGDRVFWTVLTNSIGLFIIYLLAIPLGVYSARRRGTRVDNVLSTVLFALHSLPNFWIATLFIIFFCQPAFLNWFPPYGLGDASVAEDGWGVTISTVGYHLILPIICLSYSGIAFLSRQMRSTMLDSLRQDYIRTAWAKGTPEHLVTWRHAFRNSFLPIITLFASVFPQLVAGSVVIERIFTLPGMGQHIYLAIESHDYPVTFTIIMLTAMLTMVGNLVADILYAIADPRIRFN